MHILCPHCRNPIKVIKPAPGEEIACPSCGSGFHRETLQKAVRSTISLSEGLTPELVEWARLQLTTEELAAALRALAELWEQVDKGGGLELKDFLPELERMVPH